jgi:hypothetical protein
VQAFTQQLETPAAVRRSLVAFAQKRYGETSLNSKKRSRGRLVRPQAGIIEEDGHSHNAESEKLPVTLLRGAARVVRRRWDHSPRY